MVHQLSLFDSAVQTFHVGDRVKLLPISEKQDELSYNYFKHYHPEVINKVGIIKMINKKSLGIKFPICDEIIWANEREVLFIG